ncbi:hypothetical protein [Rhodococcus aetherivorans]
MHTWTVTCDPAHAADVAGTAATELDAVVAGTAALRRLVRATHRFGEQSPFVNLVIDARPRIGLSAGPGTVTDAVERIDRYEYDAALAAAVNDSILARAPP